MSDLKHTKGNWEAGKPNTDQWSILSNGIFICMLPTNTKEAEPNAKLIAAAPELLEASQTSIKELHLILLECSEGKLELPAHIKNRLGAISELLQSGVKKATT